MQSVFPLPWSTEQLNFDRIRPSNFFDLPAMPNPKRKRSESVEQQVKRIRTNVELAPHVVPRPSEEKAPQKISAETPILKAPIPPARQPEVEAQPKLEQIYAQENDILSGGLTPAQQIIENEFNVQILMKHNELRLIEQELAKCQISLEQLRRCELRPYPGANGLSMAVTEGTGPTIAPASGFSRPSHPAPYGVLDGPYSRHYKQWLLPDPQFDPMSLQASMGASGREATRHTRTQSHAPRKSTSKAQQGSHQRVDSFNSIPNYSGSSNKDKSSPLVLRRSTDGQLVKLICKNCHRGNFSSIQGFLNHCRIAHKVDYKSHDQAAVDCGQLLDQTEVANLPLETQATPMPKPPSTRQSLSNATTTVRASNHVHQFNTTAGMPASTPRPVKRTPAIPAKKAKSVASNGFTAEPFKPSPDVPRLSHHFAKHKFGGNLEQATALAKQKIEPSIEDDFQSPGISDAGSPVASFTGSRVPTGTQQSQQQQGFPIGSSGWKGHQTFKERPRPSPLAPLAASSRDLHSGFPSSPQDLSSASLSPHTVDGNPGLVSDHEDDDHGSASEDEEGTPQAMPQTLPQTARHCSDNMEIDVEEADGMDQHGVIIRRNSMLAAQARTIRASGSPSRNMKSEN